MTTFYAADSGELSAAFAQAQSGDRIELTGTTYTAITLSNRSFTSDVTITSADVNNPAVFTEKLWLSNVSHINVSNVDVILTTLPVNSQKGQVLVTGSDNVTLSGMEIQGHIPTAADGALAPYANSTDRLDAIRGYAYGVGLGISYSDNVTVTDVEISDVRLAVGLGDSDDTKFLNLDIHDVREGIDFYDVVNLEIADSYFHDFTPWPGSRGKNNADHPDMIQYWGANSQVGVHNIYIHDNYFFQPETALATQTIFGGMSAAPTGVTATNFTITDNVIVNGHSNAIRLDGVNGFEISNNLVLPNSQTPGAGINWPMVVLRYAKNGDYSDNVVVENWAGSSADLTDANLDARNITHVGNLVLSRSATDADYWRAIFTDIYGEAQTLYLNAQDYTDAITALMTGGTTSSNGTTIVTGSLVPDTTLAVSQANGSGSEAIRAVKVNGVEVDTLMISGNGNDVFYNGDGSDDMVGGAGADRFIFICDSSSSAATDTIFDLDFDSGDTILLNSGVAGAFDDSVDTSNRMATYNNGTAALFTSLLDIKEAEAGGAIIVSAGTSGVLAIEMVHAPQVEIEIATITYQEYQLL